MYTHAIMNTLKTADVGCAFEAHYNIRDALKLLDDALDLARKNGDVHLFGACEVAGVRMREAAHLLQLARNNMKAIISQLDGSDPEETDA